MILTPGKLRTAKLFEGNRKATTRRSMKISVFFYASTLESKSKKCPQAYGRKHRRSASKFCLVRRSEQDSRKEDSVCELLETRKGSRASYHMNDEFSIFCIHNIIYNRLEKNHAKHLDFLYISSGTRQASGSKLARSRY